MTFLDDALKEAQKQLAAKKRKELPPDPTPAEAAEPIFTLGPVFDYLHHLEREPRQVLEARYRKQLGIDPPKEALHEWLVLRVAYSYQLAHYRAHGRPVPDRMLRRISDLARADWSPHDGRAFDADDPRDDLELWDDSHVVAAVRNPYARGDARKAFLAVEMTADTGIQFAPLCKTLEELLQTSVGRAQEIALQAFTKDVKEGLTKIRIA